MPRCVFPPDIEVRGYTSAAKKDIAHLVALEDDDCEGHHRVALDVGASGLQAWRPSTTRLVWDLGEVQRLFEGDPGLVQAVDRGAGRPLRTRPTLVWWRQQDKVYRRDLPSLGLSARSRSGGPFPPAEGG